MKNYNTLSNRTTRRNLLSACATALAMAFTSSLPQPAHAGEIIVPPVPDNIQVLPPNKVFLVGHAVGTQNYVCLPSGAGFAWSLFTPQATLFAGRHQQLTTHFFSPNPIEGSTVRAAWQHSRDTSTVWGAVVPGGSSSDPAFVAPGAIPWLLIQVVGAQDGLTGGDHGRSRRGVLSPSTFIQRLNTAGGVAPPTGCSATTDVGKRAFVPYTADYFFYVDEDGDHDN
jgi:uncharacterized protein DUF3455